MGETRLISTFFKRFASAPGASDNDSTKREFNTSTGDERKVHQTPSLFDNMIDDNERQNSPSGKNLTADSPAPPKTPNPRTFAMQRTNDRAAVISHMKAKIGDGSIFRAWSVPQRWDFIKGEIVAKISLRESQGRGSTRNMPGHDEEMELAYYWKQFPSWLPGGEVARFAAETALRELDAPSRASCSRVPEHKGCTVSHNDDDDDDCHEDDEEPFLSPKVKAERTDDGGGVGDDSSLSRAARGHENATEKENHSELSRSSTSSLTSLTSGCESIPTSDSETAAKNIQPVRRRWIYTDGGKLTLRHPFEGMDIEEIVRSVERSAIELEWMVSSVRGGKRKMKVENDEQSQDVEKRARS